MPDLNISVPPEAKSAENHRVTGTVCDHLSVLNDASLCPVSLTVSPETVLPRSSVEKSEAL